MLAKTEMSDVWKLAGNPLPDLHSQPKKWRALLSFPGRERRAADFLKDFGQWVYWPNYGKHVSVAPRRPGARRERRLAFFPVIPGYLFLAERADAGDPWGIVHATPGVHGFVRDSEGHAAALTDQDIEIIRHIEAGLNLPFDPKTVHRFKTGDKVRFIDDLYSRWPPGKVSRLAEDGRIVVEVAVLGRIVPILVYPHQIEAT